MAMVDVSLSNSRQCAYEFRSEAVKQVDVPPLSVAELFRVRGSS